MLAWRHRIDGTRLARRHLLMWSRRAALVTALRYDARLADLERWLARHQLGPLQALAHAYVRAVKGWPSARLTCSWGSRLGFALRRTAGAHASLPIDARRLGRFEERMLGTVPLEALRRVVGLDSCAVVGWSPTPAALPIGLYELGWPGALACVERAYMRPPADGMGLDGRMHAVVSGVRVTKWHRAARALSVLIV